MNTHYSKRYAWGTLEISANFGEASSQIRYRVNQDDDFRVTPFQVASAGHSTTKAFALVNRWLKGQN